MAQEKRASGCVLVFAKFLSSEGCLDEQALSTVEFSRALKERFGLKLVGAVVVEEAFASLAARELFARGADEVRVYAIPTEAVRRCDLWGMARIMQRAVSEAGCDLVVVGERSSDTSFGCLGGYLAGMMGLRYIRYVVEVLEVSGSSVKAVSQPEERIVMEAEAPVVLSPLSELYPPKPVHARSKIEAARKRPSVVRVEAPDERRLALKTIRRPEHRRRALAELTGVSELADVIRRALGGSA